MRMTKKITMSKYPKDQLITIIRNLWYLLNEIYILLYGKYPIDEDRMMKTAIILNETYYVIFETDFDTDWDYSI